MLLRDTLICLTSGPIFYMYNNKSYNSFQQVFQGHYKVVKIGCAGFKLFGWERIRKSTFFIDNVFY